MGQPAERQTNRRTKHPLYAKWQGRARTAKICLQMIVGVLTIVAVIVTVGVRVTQLIKGSGTIADVTAGIFAATAAGLAAAAAIELAYALYTPGPDEALDPLILGVSSTFLFLASKSPRLDWQFGVAGILFAIALYGLLQIKERFREILTNDEGEAEPRGDTIAPARQQTSPNTNQQSPEP